MRLNFIQFLLLVIEIAFFFSELKFWQDIHGGFKQDLLYEAFDTISYSFYFVVVVIMLSLPLNLFLRYIRNNLRSEKEEAKAERDNDMQLLFSDIGPELSDSLKEFLVGYEFQEERLLEKNKGMKVIRKKKISIRLEYLEKEIEGYEEFFGNFKDFSWCKTCIQSCVAFQNGSLSGSTSKDQEKRSRQDDQSRAGSSTKSRSRGENRSNDNALSMISNAIFGSKHNLEEEEGEGQMALVNYPDVKCPNLCKSSYFRFVEKLHQRLTEHCLKAKVAEAGAEENIKNEERKVNVVEDLDHEGSKSFEEEEKVLAMDSD